MIVYKVQILEMTQGVEGIFHESNVMPEIAVLQTMIDLRNRIERSNDTNIFGRAFRFNVVNYKIQEELIVNRCEYCRGIEEFADFNGGENRTAPIIYVLDNILSVVHYPHGSNSSF